MRIKDLTGQQFGSYRLVKNLAQGGFSSVYLGQHLRLASKQAAIKIFHFSEVDAQQFHQEAETTEKLKHEHIVSVLDFDIQPELDVPFLVLDYAPGGSLRSRHPRGSQLPLATIIQYLREIVPALQYAHDQHILHRDMKPDNILIGRKGELLLSDFGIAVLSQTDYTNFSNTHFGNAGTLFYMAPEQFRGKPEKASDQYALGIMVYEWLCGKVPFNQGNWLQLGYQHNMEPVPALRSSQETLSPQVEPIVLKALAKRPQERFPSVQAFLGALEAASVAPPLGTRLFTFRGCCRGVWSPDGARFALGGVNGAIQVRDARTSVLVWECDTYGGNVDALAWSPDGSRLAAGFGDQRVLVWEPNSGRVLHTYMGHSQGVNALAWSPDGSRLALGSGGWRSMDQRVHVWEASSGRVLHTYTGHSQGVNALAWSPDGLRLASGSNDQTVQVWEASSGRILYTYTGHSGKVNALAWSPDGLRLASGSNDQTVQVWEAV